MRSMPLRMFHSMGRMMGRLDRKEVSRRDAMMGHEHPLDRSRMGVCRLNMLIR